MQYSNILISLPVFLGSISYGVTGRNNSGAEKDHQNLSDIRAIDDGIQQFDSITGAGFLVDMIDVILHSARGDKEPGRDFLIGAFSTYIKDDVGVTGSIDAVVPGTSDLMTVNFSLPFSEPGAF